MKIVRFHQYIGCRMRFKGLDLNLLLGFDALLESHSVSKAAAKMRLSQAAMSSALGRLREYFGDEILVVHGKRMYPTAFAQTLVPKVREALQLLDQLVTTSRGFDPATSQRTFRLVASDYINAIVLAPLVTRFATVAPRIKLDILLPSELVIKQIEDGEVDLLITPEDYVSPDLPSEILFEEEYVVVGWRENPLMSGPITEKAFFEAGHVIVVIGNQRVRAFGDRNLESRGKNRHIEVIVPSFTGVPWLLENTARLSLMHKRLAIKLATRFPLSWVEVPFSIPKLREVAQFHETRAQDEGLIWLRSELRNAALQ
jgi:LysR family transcriptional regulator, nod-box dependent transcriptional activator